MKLGQSFGTLLLQLTILCLCMQASAQFSQNVIRRKQGNKVDYFYNADPSDPKSKTVPVVTLPRSKVVLKYNCKYMTAICKNVQNSGVVRAKTFTYDVTPGRANKRRDKVCPGNWKSGLKGVAGHKCPERNQPKVWRSDGMAWPYTALEAGPAGRIGYLIKSKKVNGKKVPSGLKYTCDEFPPASFIEGGAGLGVNAIKANTYCAAWNCGQGLGINGEQNWQGRAHKKLGSVLRKLAKIEAKSTYRVGATPIRFGFDFETKANSIPVKVLVYGIRSGKLLDENNIPFKKRGDSSEVEEDDEGVIDYGADLERFMASDYSHIEPDQEHHVHLNQTEFDFDDDDDDDLDESIDPLELLGRNLDLEFERDDDPDWYQGFDDVLEFPDTFYSPDHHRPKIMTIDSEPVRRREASYVAAPLLKNASAMALKEAEKIVEEAITESAKRNQARLDNPARNRYRLKPHTIRSRRKESAAALIAEMDSTKGKSNKTSSFQAQGGSFWMESISRQGKLPFGGDSSYKVFRNVKDYGAKGDGVSDDTQAFKDAMKDGARCGDKCNGSTTKNAIVYVPPGTYLISTTVPVLFATQLIGDANNPPTLKASKRFIGLGVLSTDQYTGGGLGSDGLDQEWYINTANFYRQIRNFKIDVTDTRSSQAVAGIHYQIAQATSLQHVDFIAKEGTKQMGVFSENGSGGLISDLTFTGGEYGFYGGNQQFTALRLKFDGCSTAVRVIWDWGWVWKSITVKNAKIGFQLVTEDKKGDGSSTKKRDDIKAGKNGSIGSASFMDSVFSGVGTAVVVKPLSSKPGSGSTGLIFDNVSLKDVDKAVADTSGKTILDGGSSKIDFWVTGPTYAPDRAFVDGDKKAGYTRNDKLMNDDGVFFERPKPQYEDLSADRFLSVRSMGAAGDGVTDDTEALQNALFAASNTSQILFVDSGSYILKSTVVVPAGAKIVGEAWSQLLASGEFFSDAANPQVMLQVGYPGDKGSVEMQDLIFTTKGPTAGVILVEWNIEADKPGSAALWDCHARIGGAKGTDLTPAECPPVTSGVNEKCQAASLMMHITSRASGYFENMWLWVADHMIDDPALDNPNNDMVQTSVYVARGMLIESQEPTWLYGTASEHSVFYQYNFYNAENVFAAMIQTESPYYQPNPKPPAPFNSSVGYFESDPSYHCSKDDEDFNGCDSSWALLVQKSKDIFIAGAGLYSWFSTYSQDCIDTQECQKILSLFKNNYKGVRIQHMITIGAKYMARVGDTNIAAKDNLNVKDHPSWSQVSVLEIDGQDGNPDDPSPGSGDGEVIWIDPKLWDPDSSHVIQCVPPCTLQLPPWTKTTSTIQYPPVTYYTDDFTTTVTRSAIRVTEWIVSRVTLSGNILPPDGTSSSTTHSPGIIGTITPSYATTTFWPPVHVTLPDGKTTTTVPPDDMTHPPPPTRTKPPSSTDNDFPPPVVVKSGSPPSPTTTPCAYVDFSCPPRGDDPDGPGGGGEEPGGPGGDEDPSDPDDPESPFFCFNSDEKFPDGNECKSTQDCNDCGGDDANVCDTGYCRCRPKLGLNDHKPPDDPDIDNKCGSDADCDAAFACSVDRQHPVCEKDKGTCTCSDPPAPDYYPCSHQDEEPGLGITSAYCVCDHSTFAEKTNTMQTPYNSCAYTTKPTSTISVSRPTPTPSGTICMGTYYDAGINTTSGDSWALWKAGDFCNDKNGGVLNYNPFVPHDLCDFYDFTSIICGKNVTIEKGGPETITSECKEGISLNIDGKRYGGRKVADDTPCNDKGCHIGIGYSETDGYVYFPHVPACE